MTETATPQTDQLLRALWEGFFPEEPYEEMLASSSPQDLFGYAGYTRRNSEETDALLQEGFRLGDKLYHRCNALETESEVLRRRAEGAEREVRALKDRIIAKALDYP